MKRASSAAIKPIPLSFWVKEFREHAVGGRGKHGIVVTDTILEDAVTFETITVRGRVGEIGTLIHFREVSRDSTMVGAEG